MKEDVTRVYKKTSVALGTRDQDAGTDWGKGLRGKWLTSVKKDTFPARTMYPQGRHPTRPKCLFHHCFHRWFCRPPAMASLRHSASDRFT
ncbi:hypothetical protein JZ751_015534, partial [Albula glossodonta]